MRKASTSPNVNILVQSRLPLRPDNTSILFSHQTVSPKALSRKICLEVQQIQALADEGEKPIAALRLFWQRYPASCRLSFNQGYLDQNSSVVSHRFRESLSNNHLLYNFGAHRLKSIVFSFPLEANRQQMFLRGEFSSKKLKILHTIF